MLLLQHKLVWNLDIHIEHDPICLVFGLGGSIRPHHNWQPILKGCPSPTPVFTGRHDILSKMHAYFSTNVGKRHVFVLYGLGGSGKSQIAFKFVEECQADAETHRYAMLS